MKILIADDDPIDRDVLAETLRRMQHDVATAENGLKAWETFQNTHFPILICDWMMPEMDGLEVSRAIRKVQRDSYTFIIMLTSMSGRANYLEAMKAGVDDFLNKPFDEEHLEARLHVAERVLGLRHHVKKLEGLLPICAYCKKIRDERNEWQQIESYIAPRSEAKFSHSFCPDCYEKIIKPQLKR